MDTNEHEQPVIDLGKAYNPYEDPGLVTIKVEEPADIDTREPFNDVIKYGDIIVGHQQNRTLSDYPRNVRPWVRLSSIVALILLVGSIIWDFVH